MGIPECLQKILRCLYLILNIALALVDIAMFFFPKVYLRYSLTINVLTEMCSIASGIGSGSRGVSSLQFDDIRS